jgi:hypothetical protein
MTGDPLPYVAAAASRYPWPATRQAELRGYGVVDAAAGKFASAHDFRRAFGTRWARKLKPATLQLLMRHATIQTTMKYYVEIDADDVAAELWEVWKTVPPGCAPTRRLGQEKLLRETAVSPGPGVKQEPMSSSGLYLDSFSDSPIPLSVIRFSYTV